MNKDIRLSISGLHMSDEQNSIEQEYLGTYYFKDGKHYIFYEEQQDSGEKVKSTIKISNGIVKITKKGLYEYQMIFEESKSNVSYVCTPFGRLEVEVFTNSIELGEEENAIGVHIEYALKIDKEHLSECRVGIKICPQ